MRRILFFLALITMGSGIQAQPEDYNSADIQRRIKKLNVLGTVLYLAAHPDDENTRLITYFSKNRLLNTAYLSLTRGDGGQNSIGPEIREELGIIRTQELLAARRIDGGNQFFSRAIDFGYSKNADETLQIWDRQLLLSDVVWVIRKFRPDIVVTRFPPNRNAGHGQHEASALLGLEAYDAAGDPDRFTEQFQWVEPWQPERVMVNTGWWWNRDIKATDPGVSTVDVGEYSPLLGKSYTEIAAFARSQHKSQSFGVSSSRGESIEFLEQAVGSAASNDPLEGIDLSWSRVADSEGIPEMVDNIESKFDHERPHTVIPDLLALRKRISQLKDAFWRERKLQEVDYLIRACAGLFFEARAGKQLSYPGDSLEVTMELINRSPSSVLVRDIRGEEIDYDTILNSTLEFNQDLTFRAATVLPEGMPFTNPYWLEKPHDVAHYTIEDRQIIGKAENDPAITFDLTFEVEGEEIHYAMPLVFRYTDNIKGEVYQPFEIGPPVYTRIESPVYIFPDDEPAEVNVILSSAALKKQKGRVRLEVPDGWEVFPASVEFNIAEPGAELSVSFFVKPLIDQGQGTVRAFVEMNGSTYNQGIRTVDYPHIPLQTHFPRAEASVTRIDLKKAGEKIGYIEGAGDGVAASLRQIGYDVTLLDHSDLVAGRLKDFDAIVFGVMVFNDDEEIGKYNDVLLDYVKNGGNILVQYVNGRVRRKSEIIAPYPITLTRNSAASRVSVETAPVRVLVPDHPAMRSPNRITQADFEGWVQERGLYFPVEWDDEYTALFSSNDPDEPPLDGGLLVAPYGEGFYVYTSYSWFRQLPAGVPGAFRIFTNLISLGK